MAGIRPTKKKAASRKKAKPSRNTAQTEFARYKARAGSPHGPMGAMGNPFPQTVGFPQVGEGLPTWAFPPSVAALSPAPGPGFFAPGVVPPGVAAAGSLTERLRTTLRLGADLLNAGLAGGVRVLGGFSSAAHELGGWTWGHPCHDWYGYGCPCMTECACYDCCCLLGAGGYCQPSVGTCC